MNDRHALAERVSAVMGELNSLTLACGALETAEGNSAKDKLGRAWSAAYDARAQLEKVPLI